MPARLPKFAGLASLESVHTNRASSHHLLATSRKHPLDICTVFHDYEPKASTLLTMASSAGLHHGMSDENMGYFAILGIVLPKDFPAALSKLVDL